MTLERVQRGFGVVGGGREPLAKARDGRVSGRRPIGLGQGVVDELGDPGKLFERLLGLEPADRPAIARTFEGDHGAVEDRPDPLEPPRDRRQPLGKRREIPGDEREDPVAQQVHPLQRVPGLVPKLGLGEPLGFELHDQQVAVDRVAGREIGGPEPFERREPPVDEVEPRHPTGLGHVRPSIVVAVVADRRGGRRMERDELVEERREAALEVGHAPESRRWPGLVTDGARPNARRHAGTSPPSGGYGGGRGFALLATTSEPEVQRRHDEQVEQGRCDEPTEDDDGHRVLDLVAG